MTYYFKRIDTEGNVISLITCNQQLKESTAQLEITEAEYNELYAALPQDEETNEATEADYIESLESLGVTFNE